LFDILPDIIFIQNFSVRRENTPVLRKISFASEQGLLWRGRLKNVNPLVKKVIQRSAAPQW